MTLQPHVWLRMAYLGLTLLGGVLGACEGGQEYAPMQAAPQPSERSTLEEQASPPQGMVELTATLKQAHQLADRAASKEERQEAAQRLTAVFEEAARIPSPHVLAVRQDLAARASHLRLEEAPLEAKRLANQGLALSDAPSVLLANLFIALADAEEALGNPSEARSALVSALTINEQLFLAELQHP